MSDTAVSATLTPAANKLVKPKTRKGKRFLEKRGSKLVEDAKRALLLFGGSTSQTIKEALTDLHKLKGVDSVKYSRNNEQIKPFEAGGEASLEFYANRCNCSLFALGTHTKKRPHNLVLGRLYDFHLYDAIELGIDNLKAIQTFGGAAAAQAGNKPCIMFAGEKFETVPQLKLAKSLLLDFFRGLQVGKVNLAGLDRVMLAVALDDNKILLRQYHMTFKKSGTKVPRAALVEMGPSMDLTVRRVREAPADLAKEAMQQPKLKTKTKNVSTDSLDGKVGRIYMPKQTFDNIGLTKPKGLKKERRAAAAGRELARNAPKAAALVGAAGGDEVQAQTPRKRQKVTLADA